VHKRLIVIVVSVLVVVLAAAILLIRGCGQEKEKELPPVKTTKPKPAVVHRPPKVVTSKAQ
jgi:flagellar basal body-associated protein FliL